MLRSKRKNHKKSISFSYALLFIASLQFFIYAICITGGYSQQNFLLRENLNTQQISVQQLNPCEYLLNSTFQQLLLLYKLALSAELLHSWKNSLIERNRNLLQVALSRNALRKALSLSRTARQIVLSTHIFGSNLSDGSEDADFHFASLNQSRYLKTVSFLHQATTQAHFNLHLA